MALFAAHDPSRPGIRYSWRWSSHGASLFDMTDFAESRFTFCSEGPIVGGKLAYSTLEMASSAGHHAAFIATFAPSAMIFVLCRDGRSHTPDEWAEPDAVVAGASAMLEAITRLDKTLDTHSPTGLSI